MPRTVHGRRGSPPTVSRTPSRGHWPSCSQNVSSNEPVTPGCSPPLQLISWTTPPELYRPRDRHTTASRLGNWVKKSHFRQHGPRTLSSQALWSGASSPGRPGSLPAPRFPDLRGLLLLGGDVCGAAGLQPAAAGPRLAERRHVASPVLALDPDHLGPSW